ncbi:MAG: ABC transporter ATP-binding protein [Candidatus Humimicrobiia bacterium]
MIIQTENLTKIYGEKETKVIALNNVNLSVREGEFLAITGPSGSGKTTLLNLIGTLDEPTSGNVLFDEVDIGKLKGNKLSDFRREKIGFVFQLFNLIDILTALENVKIPLIPYLKECKFNLNDRAKELLSSVGLEGRGNHLPGQLSGGEQQRVAIARALINEPNLILADEPTGNVDIKAGDDIIALLQQLNRKRGVNIILVTHNIALAQKTDRILNLRDGKLIDDK